MRFCLVALLLLLSGYPSQATTLTALESGLQRFGSDPLIRVEARAVIERLPSYHRLIQEADSLSQLDSLEIMMIGTWHLTRRPDEKQMKKVKDSQDRAYDLLDSLQCDILAMDGLNFGRVDRPTMWTMFADMLRKERPDISDRAIDRYIKTVREYDAVVRYLWKHPQTHLIGCEDPALNELQVRYFDVPIETSKKFYSVSEMAWFQFGDDIRKVRTELAVASMIIELHRLGKTKGVAIHGIYHAEEWPDIAQRYRLKTAIFPCVGLPLEK